MWGPVCVVSGYGRWAVAWQDPASRGLVRVYICIWRPGQVKSTQLKSVIHGRQYLRGTFEFPGVTPLFDFILTSYSVLSVMFVCNKLFNFTGWRLLSGLFICAYEVTQRITTSVIPLEAIRNPVPKRPHNIEQFMMCSKLCNNIKQQMISVNSKLCVHEVLWVLKN